MQLDMSFLPDGKTGEWEISTFTVQDRELSQMISAIRYGRSVPGGTYKRLKRGGTVVMSNTPDELRDFSYFLNRAHSSVLINGLGMGCLVKALLEKHDVTEITVIENSEDVISLVVPYFNDKRLTIIHADAFEYQPPKGKKYDFVWHDIWDYICSDNLPEMGKLHRKYGKRTNILQESWAKDRCQQIAREDKRYGY